MHGHDRRADCKPFDLLSGRVRELPFDGPAAAIDGVEQADHAVDGVIDLGPSHGLDHLHGFIKAGEQLSCLFFKQLYALFPGLPFLVLYGNFPAEGDRRAVRFQEHGAQRGGASCRVAGGKPDSGHKIDRVYMGSGAAKRSAVLIDHLALGVRQGPER